MKAGELTSEHVGSVIRYGPHGMFRGTLTEVTRIKSTSIHGADKMHVVTFNKRHATLDLEAPVSVYWRK